MNTYSIYKYVDDEIKFVKTEIQEIKELYETEKLVIQDALDKTEFNIGVYYNFIEINYDEAKKYYMMAIEKGNNYAMNNLGCYYHFIEKNYELAKKYYMMAIEKDDEYAMTYLGNYYEKQKNYEWLKSII